ncbi:MAG: hypothetical protein Q7T44_17910 [Parvibaculum sp.]|nr:hypothetical protein [Parvibaculum sp.]
MVKNTVLVSSIIMSLATFSALVAVVTLAFKVLLLAFVLVVASLVAYSLLVFVWKKVTGRSNR